MGLWVPAKRPEEPGNSRIRILDKDGNLLREVDPPRSATPPCRRHKIPDCRKCIYAGRLAKRDSTWPSWETDPW